MMKANKLLLLTAFSVLSYCSYAQIAMNGVAHKHPYAGLQPEFVRGVSALPAVDKPQLRHIYMVDKHILAMTIDERAVILDNLKPYLPEPGDRLLMQGYHGLAKVLERDGKRIANLCGNNNEWMRPYNCISGEKLNLEIFADPLKISIFPEGQTEQRVHIKEIYRKTYPIDRTHTSLRQNYPMRHEIYLILDKVLEPGNTYVVDLPSNNQFNKKISVDFNSDALRSEAIHVNLYGFMPSENKVAYVSTWLGDGSSYQYGEDLPYRIVDASSGKTVLSGYTFIRTAADEAEYEVKGKSYNHNLTDVLGIDFTALQDPGLYKIVLDGIGCSFPFEINPNSMENVSKLMMKGYLHQRSGIELGPPYTDYLRPRNMHPADGARIHKCDMDKFFELDEGGQQGIFTRIKASIDTNTLVPEAWGGWMDAADFDQRMTHYGAVRRMIFLYQLNPEYFANDALCIPESGNGIPDLLDEARWCIDLQRRTQGVYEDGGISWWVESIEHPRGGESSWTHSLPTALIPPTPRAALNYAATAAQMAKALQSSDKKLAEEYLESALKAMDWLEEYPDREDPFGHYDRKYTEAMAYVSLYATTGDQAWHKKFRKQLKVAFPNGIAEDANRHNVEILAYYALLEDQETDDEIKEACTKGILQVADKYVEGSMNNTYGVLKDPKQVTNRMTTFSRLALPLAMAHHLTKESVYIDAMSGTVQYLFGANPMNRSYISGLGERFFGPYSIDWEANNMGMPAGIPTYGPTTLTEEKWGWQGNYGVKEIEREGLYPQPLLSWPHPERCFNQVWLAPTNEFTVDSPMGDILVISAYLAQLMQKDEFKYSRTD